MCDGDGRVLPETERGGWESHMVPGAQAMVDDVTATTDGGITRSYPDTVSCQEHVYHASDCLMEPRRTRHGEMRQAKY